MTGGLVYRMRDGLVPWAGRRAVWGLAVALLLLSAPTFSFAQEEGEPSEPAPPPPSVERAREAFREAIERIWVPRYRLTNGPQVRTAFRDVVAKSNKATVRIRSGGKNIAMGGIVGPDGWVLTKASRLKGQHTVLLQDKRELDARVVGIDRDNDLAMLKIDAKDLPSLQLSDEAQAVEGGWVATPGLENDPLAIGVVSVAPRKIPHRPGILGIQMEDAPADLGPGAQIVKVYADTGAERAGVLVNDVVIRINNQPIKNRDDLRQEVRRYSPGDELELEVRRGEQIVILTATLSGTVKEMFPQTRSQYQNSLGSELSQRRFGFPMALQHDTVLKPSECGGPLVDLEGRVIGFNIARAGRTESYAIPTKTVLPLMYKLMSGKKAPEEG